MKYDLPWCFGVERECGCDPGSCRGVLRDNVYLPVCFYLRKDAGLTL